MTVETVLSISDLHIPYQDDRAIDLVHLVIEMLKPDRLIFNGDVVDCYPLSGFNKNPETLRKGGFQQELNAWNTIAGSLVRTARVQVPKVKLHYLIGNHEERLSSFLWRYPALFGLETLTIERLLGLAELGIEYNKDELMLANDELAIRHGSVVGKDSGLSAKGELENDRYHISTMTAHCHRLGHIFVKTPYGVVEGVEQGCLCKLDPEYIKKPNWQLGIGLAHINNDDNWFSLEAIPFYSKWNKLYTIIHGEYLSV